MNLLSYLAFLGVLGGLAFAVHRAVAAQRSAVTWGATALALAAAVQSAAQTVVLGAQNPDWAAAARAVSAPVAVVLTAGMLAFGVVAWGALSRSRRWQMVIGAAAGLVLLVALPWAAGPLLVCGLVWTLRRSPSLARWERRLPQVLPDPVVFLDRQHRITSLNPPAARQFEGLAPGQDLAVVLGNPAKFHEAWVAAESRAPQGEPLALFWSGDPVTLALSPLYDRFGDLVGAVGFLRSGGDHEWEARLARLSPRERDVVRLVVEGLSNQAIADRLFLSEGTVKRHVHSILSKVAVRRREELRVLRVGP